MQCLINQLPSKVSVTAHILMAIKYIGLPWSTLEYVGLHCNDWVTFDYLWITCRLHMNYVGLLELHWAK